MSHIPVPGEDVYSFVIHPQRECTSSMEMRMCLNENGDVTQLTGNGDVTQLTGNGDVTQLTGNGDVTQLTGNGDVTHRSCTSSLGIHILYTG